MNIDESKIKYVLTCFPEDINPQEMGHSKEGARVLLKNQDVNPWAWCGVKVTATYKNIFSVHGIATLGGCSYKSEEDFKRNSMYWEELKEDARNDLLRQLEEIYHAIT